MSAIEVIEQIKALPQPELAKVMSFIGSYFANESEGAPFAVSDDSNPGRAVVMDRDKARQISRRIMAENHELFRKLAQ